MELIDCWRYPVKSMQGFRVDSLVVTPTGVRGDRRWALIDTATGKLASAKRFSALLDAAATEDVIVLPSGQRIDLDDAEHHVALSEWLGRRVQLAEVTPTTSATYQMTFDPPNDQAELIDIPAPIGTFLDGAPLHLVAAGTLRACREARPDLDWDVRRFRPNAVIDGGGDGLFGEQDWIGRQLRIGEVEITVIQPTVRCAVPLRAQPGLERQPDLFAALNDLNTKFPNHLGIYAAVTRPGTIRLGDPVEVLS